MTKDLKKGERISVEKLIELYDSHGLNPEIVKEYSSVPVEVPDNFYKQVAKKHEKPETEQAETKVEYPENMPTTRHALLRGRRDHWSSRARSLQSYQRRRAPRSDRLLSRGRRAGVGRLAILDGQKVTKVIKVNSSVLHYLDGPIAGGRQGRQGQDQPRPQGRS